VCRADAKRAPLACKGPLEGLADQWPAHAGWASIESLGRTGKEAPRALTIRPGILPVSISQTRKPHTSYFLGLGRNLGRVLLKATIYMASMLSSNSSKHHSKGSSYFQITKSQGYL
jgi:hypothetical protein